MYQRLSSHSRCTNADSTGRFGVSVVVVVVVSINVQTRFKLSAVQTECTARTSGFTYATCRLVL